MTQDQFDYTGPSNRGGGALQRAGFPVPAREPFSLGPMPSGRAMEVVDQILVRAPLQTIFDLARQVEQWPAYLSHYRWVRFHERASDGGGVVGMSAWRPFGVVGWPTWWKSQMTVDAARPAIRFLHIGGITTDMDVEWTFAKERDGVRVRIVHVWDGPRWPLVGVWAATSVIGPVFIHGIASRTLKGLAAVAERAHRR